jgi:hypothetical protein
MEDVSQRIPPPAQRAGLLIQAVDDEVIVYDTERHKAHCLNRTAARVWERCDGQATVADLARHLTQALEAPVAPAAVWLAVEQLGKARLLTERPGPPRGPSRREVLKRLGVAAALALPLVTTIVTPVAAQGASCGGFGVTCTSTSQCCPPLICDTTGSGTCEPE